MQRKKLDLLLLIAIAFMNVVFVCLLPNSLSFIRVVLALLLVFLAPGYALTEVLFYGGPPDSIYRYRFVLSLGLNLTLDVVSGIILNLLPTGLQATSWVICLSVLTIVFSLAAMYRRRKSPGEGIKQPLFPFSIRRDILLGVSLVIAVAIVFLSIQFSVINVVQQPHPGFTQLWMLPSSHAAENCAVDLSIQSFEVNSVTYRVSMYVDGNQVNIWSSVVLAPQEQWNRQVPLSVALTNSIFVKVLLYRLDKPEAAYREVHLTLHGVSKTQGCTT
jgi:uncharacterized membrane protein